MVATNEPKQAKPRGTSRGRQRKPDEAAPDSATAAETPARGSRPRKPPAVVKVRSREAARRIRGLADVSERLDVRERLRRLSRQVGRGPGDAQKMAFVETAVGECLDEAAGHDVARERWLLCEAATWALAWMARTKRAGGSAGGLLERIVREARGARTALASRDTLSARFVLVVARLFADIEACRCLEADATAAVAEEILRLVSAEGTIGLAGSEAAVERVIRWTTIRDVAAATGRPAWSDDVEAAWGRGAVAGLRLLGGQGRILAGAGLLPACFSAPLLDAVEDAAGPVLGRAARRTVRALRSGRAAPRRRLLPRDLHDPAAALAIIRTGWARGAIRVLLDSRDAVPRLEIAVDDRLVFDGPWTWAATMDGRPLDAEGAWSVSGWETDRKATFLEIVAPLSGGMQIARQVVVLARDRIVLVADALTPRPGVAATVAELGYRGCLPLAAALDGDLAEETNEIFVYDTSMRCMALPLALPEWRSAGSGTFTAAPEGLILSQRGRTRLHAPLWIDCDASRIGRPLTWRRLTVADTRVNLPPHQAAGYRVQAGPDQWLLYQALDQARNRSLLGCNVSCEFLVGRVRRGGAVSRTLEIQ